MALILFGLVRAEGEEHLSPPGLIVSVADTNPPPPELFQPVQTLAKGLRSPDGLAWDGLTGDLYISEESAAAIVCRRPNGSRHIAFDSSTPIYEETDGKRVQAPGLRSPEGLAWDGKDTLYVVEDVPGGRVIAFPLREKSGGRKSGLIVPIPLGSHQFAWENISARPNGELLLVGSTMEAAQNDAAQGGLFRGGVLYRDEKGAWWMPINHAMASYSAISFSPDGSMAFFGCEFPGTVGVLDLRSKYLRTFVSNHSFHSPEHLYPLPGGAVLIASENGQLIWWDPTLDRIQRIHDLDQPIETILWDPLGRRLLVTADQQGELLALPLLAQQNFRPAWGGSSQITFKAQSTPVEMIPESPPKYLADVLKLGGYDPFREIEPKLSFRDFARRYCLIALDARTKLLPQQRPVADPIKRIQFVVVAPYLIGFQEGELIWSSSGFTVVRESGEVFKTELVKRQVIHGDLLESRFTPVGGQNIALPMPFSARINADGHVAVNFLGMGVVADFYLVLDPGEPDNSAMVVVYPDGAAHQYQVMLPPRRDRSHWVVALEHREPDAWKSLPLKRAPLRPPKEGAAALSAGK